MGSGESDALIHLANRLGSSAPRMLGITYRKPVSMPKIIALENRLGANRFQVWTGRFLEDIPIAEIPKADLITDLLGPFSYTDDPEQVLRIYLDILRPNGKAHLYLNIWHNSFLLPWFKACKGFDALLTDDPKIVDQIAITLIRNHDPVEIPQLRELAIIDHSPPIRDFEIITKK